MAPAGRFSLLANSEPFSIVDKFCLPKHHYTLFINGFSQQTIYTQPARREDNKTDLLANLRAVIEKSLKHW